MRCFKRNVLAIGVVAASLLCASLAHAQDPVRWYSVDEQKNVKVHLYVFHSQRCSHCLNAMRFLDQLEKKHRWLVVTRYETSAHPENLQYYQTMAKGMGRVAGQVPAFFFCRQLEIGYVSDATGQRLEASLIRCRESLQRQVTGQTRAATLGAILTLLANPLDVPVDDLKLPEPDDKVDLPLWGSVEAADVSLPLLTLVIAACDAFNPCAFFVLLFLLSLLVHGHSRARMAIIGGIFVFSSAAVYFLFMAAWLNLFLIFGHLAWITSIAGLVAVAIALINIKEFFWFKRGVSLTIPESAKPGIFQRMTRLVGESRLWAMVAGTIFLAFTTNLYELLCTSGFPMVYTRVLTLRDLPATAHVGYLILYNLIYVTPLALIVVGFVWTLGARKLTEYEGRALKLLSGVMMLLLGGLLIVAPERLSHASSAIVMLAASIAITALVAVCARGKFNEPATLSLPHAPH